ncbi:GTP pyrophosphokinase family protein [Mariniluteicoccus endophyticus]
MAVSTEREVHQSRPDTLSEVEGFRRFMQEYKFGLDEVMTKINILREDLLSGPGDCPIEHVSARLKTPESLLRKATLLGVPLTLEAFADHIPDLAGVRVVVSFLSDVSSVRDMILQQPDIHLVELKDYVNNPKPNGYRSLHLIVDTPVHLASGPTTSRVEIQIRTSAMDFWAALQHKINYKYVGQVPPTLLEELTSAADVAMRLDEKMQALHREMHPG